MARKRKFYFCFRSPYSWIGARLLEEQLERREYDIEYIPFWEPDAQSLALLEARGGQFWYTPMSRSKHLYILQDVRRLTKKLGYRSNWPVDHEPWWELSHLAYLAANRQGKGHEFFWAVYRARWEEGRDISAPATIRALAEALDLDADRLVAATDDPSIRAEGVEALYRCYKDGVFGIPFFINGYDKFWGIDRLADFVASLKGDGARSQQDGLFHRRLSVQSTTCLAEHYIDQSSDAYAADHAGGCG